MKAFEDAKDVPFPKRNNDISSHQKLVILLELSNFVPTLYTRQYHLCCFPGSIMFCLGVHWCLHNIQTYTIKYLLALCQVFDLIGVSTSWENFHPS